MPCNNCIYKKFWKCRHLLIIDGAQVMGGASGLTNTNFRAVFLSFISEIWNVNFEIGHEFRSINTIFLIMMMVRTFFALEKLLFGQPGMSDETLFWSVTVVVQKLCSCLNVSFGNEYQSWYFVDHDNFCTAVGLEARMVN